MSTDKYHFFLSFLQEEIHFSVPNRLLQRNNRDRAKLLVPRLNKSVPNHWGCAENCGLSEIAFIGIGQ